MASPYILKNYKQTLIVFYFIFKRLNTYFYRFAHVMRLKFYIIFNE